MTDTASPRRILVFLAAAAILPACGGGGGGGGAGGTAPGVFSLLSPSDAATGLGTSVTFVWASAAGASTYRLQIATDAAFTSLVVDQQSIAPTSYTPATALAQGTLHHWRAFAVNAFGFTPSASARTFTTAPAAGSPPGPFTHATPANAAVGVSIAPTFTWTGSTGAASYTLQVSDTAAFATMALEQSGISGTAHTPSSVLANLATYYWRVIAVNGAGPTTATGAPWSFTTQASSGSPPGAFTLANPPDGSSGVSRTPAFTWTASSGANTYTLQVSTSAAFPTYVIDQPNIGATTYAAGVTLGYSTLYYWRVIAVNAQGQTTATGAPWSFTTRPLPGTLDASFDGDGKVVTAIGPGSDQAFDVAVQADGKIVAVGRTFNGSKDDFAVVRYNPNGSLDTTFDTDGIVTTAIGSAGDGALAVAIQADGKIVAAGYSGTGTANAFALVRYNPDGSLDTTFDTDGRVTTVVPPNGGLAWDVALQADGKIVATGTSNSGLALVRFNADGSLDSTFGTGGIVTTNIASTGVGGYSFGIAIQGDGRAVVVGQGPDPVLPFAVNAAARYNTNGSLDPSFDGDGWTLTRVPPGSPLVSSALEVALQADGKIVAAGWNGSGNGQDIAVVRYNTDGSLDTTFDGDGAAVTNFGLRAEQANDVVIQADGKIVVAGYWEQNSGNRDFALARYLPDGSLDALFDIDGKLTVFIGAGEEEAQALRLQPDGKIVAAGWSHNGTDNDFALIRIWD